MGKRIVAVFLYLVFLSPVAAAESEISPPYTVMIALSYASPYVDDGRSSFADFAFSVSFKHVRFRFDPGQPLPMLGFHIMGGKGKGTLTRHTLNKVQTGCGTVIPKVTKAPDKEFDAWLSITPGPFHPEWMKGKQEMITPMPLQFMTSWGMDMMKWDYEEGHAYLGEEGIEVFIVDWASLSHGIPISLELPYPGDPEAKGGWWIEFIPEKTGTE